MTLSEMECRILAALAEKEIATPEYYPMTVKALTAACNQKNNRNPVVSYAEPDVETCLEAMRFKNLVWQVNPAGARVSKYEHNLIKTYQLDKQELILLCELMLRGPQTPAELKKNASRLFPFSHMIQIETAMKNLADETRGPLVLTLPRQPGQKEERIAHLLCGPIDLEAFEAAATSRHTPISYGSGMETLLEEIAQLRSELAQLREEFEAFKQQF